MFVRETEKKTFRCKQSQIFKVGVGVGGYFGKYSRICLLNIGPFFCSSVEQKSKRREESNIQSRAKLGNVETIDWMWELPGGVSQVI